MSQQRIQFRRETSAAWALNNPTLALGEPGYETDTRRWKIGDGNLPWLDLPWKAETGPEGPQGPQGLTGPPGNGPQGIQGLTGATGEGVLTEMTLELAGGNCPYGGVRIIVGIDAN